MQICKQFLHQKCLLIYEKNCWPLHISKDLYLHFPHLHFQSPQKRGDLSLGVLTKLFFVKVKIQFFKFVKTIGLIFVIAHKQVILNATFVIITLILYIFNHRYNFQIDRSTYMEN